MGKVYSYGLTDFQAIATGAAVLASGGGGSYHDACAIVQELADQGFAGTVQVKGAKLWRSAGETTPWARSVTGVVKDGVMAVEAASQTIVSVTTSLVCATSPPVMVVTTANVITSTVAVE